MKTKMQHLTKAYILDKDQVLPIVLYKEFLIPQESSSNFLLIYSTTIMFSKITIYPVNNLPIIKFFLHGSNLHEDTINQILSTLNNVSPTILHTSGIMFRENQYCYELYFSDVGKQDLSSFKNNILNLQGIEGLEDSIVPLYKI